ncbi:hypothetical protein GE061_013969 [Apolygus lucorum]|uniref:Cyclic nucleotide-binding domain-containing protein n=1 Tax=Apolygus lucorum TaxID=248454 RepID=A0A8S9XRJ0_APOLU|nr:hypothetical protein GE061_013969 [Apolygus lucorum]
MPDDTIYVPAVTAINDEYGRFTEREEEVATNLVLFLCSLIMVLVLVASLILRYTTVPTRFPTTLLIGWVTGKLIETYKLSGSTGVMADYLPDIVVHMFIPPLFYMQTLNVDYHTFSRSMGQILGVSLPAFTVHCVLVTGMIWPILDKRVRWPWVPVLVFVTTLASATIDSTIERLKQVHGQLRQLHLLLQGEKVISVVAMSYVIPVIFKYYNPLNVEEPRAMDVASFLGWLLFCSLPALFTGLFYRYLLNFAYNEIIAQAALSLTTVVFCYWFAEFLGGGGALSVLCFGIATGCSKLKFSSEAEKFFGYFWPALGYVLTNIVYILAGVLLGAQTQIAKSTNLGFVLVFYGMCMMSRTIALVTMGLIYIARSGWIAWKHYVVALWGVYKGSTNMILAIYVYVTLRYPHGFEILMYVTCTTMLSIFVNVIALNQLLRAIGMYDLSQSRILNMDAAVILVNHCREKAIMSLKMDRVIADANWLVVDQTTKLPHPYSRILADIEASGNDQNANARVITCMECNAESVAPLTKKELIDLTLEAKHRILKAQMMSFWKQSENGTLSGHGYRFLVNLVEMASVRDDPLLSLKDLKIQREGSLTLRRLKAFFGYLYTITSTTHRFIPTNWLRALCFRMCTSRAFQIMMACLCLIDLGLLINFLIIYYFQYDAEVESGRTTKNHVYQLFDFIFFSIFFLEFMIFLLGIGVVQYFQSNVNKIEFATGVVIRPTELGMILDSYYRHNITNLLLVEKCIIFTKTLLLLRFARIYIFIVALIPKMLNVVDRRMDDDLIKEYDIGKAYIIALDKVIKFLGYIVDNEIVFSYLTEYMENERRIVTKELGLIQKDRPTIAITIKTRHAVRHVINTMNDCVDDMKEEGMLDWSENQTLKTSLLKVKKRIRNLILISPSPPDSIIKEVPWLFGDHETCNFFSEHAMLSSYARKGTIVYHGDEPYGLYILVSGLVRSFYKPSDTTTFLAKTYGVLPNYDFFMNHHKLDSPQEEYIIGGGNVIGELGVITGRKYDMTVICETSCQVYYIPWKIIQAVVHDSSNAPVIKARIWKAVAIKIGVNLLPYTPRFQGWSREKLLLYLQRGIVPVLDNVTVININNEIIEDLFLVEGMGMDMATRSIFFGPMMIPRTIQKLLLPNSPLWDFPTDYRTHLLVIPCMHAYVEDMMGPEGIFKGNYKEAEGNEKGESEEGEEDEDDEEEDYDDEEEEEEGGGGEKEVKESKDGKGAKEAEKVDENASKSKCQHKQKLTPEMLLKLRRKKRNKRITFLDYIPTLAGPLEGNIASTTFIIKSKHDKEVRTMLHNRTVDLDSTIKYTQDIEETSEIGEAKDDEVDVSMTSTKQKLKKSKSYSFGDRFSTHSGLSQAARKPSDAPKKIELMVIESESDFDESINEKEMQTSLRMMKTRTMRRFLRGIKASSREIEGIASSNSGLIM